MQQHTIKSKTSESVMDYNFSNMLQIYKADSYPTAQRIFTVQAPMTSIINAMLDLIWMMVIISPSAPIKAKKTKNIMI